MDIYVSVITTEREESNMGDLCLFNCTHLHQSGLKRQNTLTASFIKTLKLGLLGSSFLFMQLYSALKKTVWKLQ